MHTRAKPITDRLTDQHPALAKNRIILAEDDGDFRSYLAAMLRVRGHRVTEVCNGAELLQELNFDGSDSSWTPCFDAVVTDVRMPGVTGTSVLEGLSWMGAAGQVVLMSAFADETLMRRACALGVGAVLSKPFSLEAFLEVVERAVASSQRRGWRPVGPVMSRSRAAAAL